MIAGITHLTMEAEITGGIRLAGQWARFEPDFIDELDLPRTFEDVEDSDGTLPLALLTAPGGIRLEVVQHRAPSGRPSAYEGIFASRPPPSAGHVAPGRPEVRDVLLRAGVLTDPMYAALPVPGGGAWFDASGATDGLAGVLCEVGDVRAEADFWSGFARTTWHGDGTDAAWASMSSPVLPAPCAFVVVRGDPATRPTPHAMNDRGFPSIGVASTSIDADCARAVAAGATLRSEPIVTTVGGRPLRMALIETPGGAPVELLAAHRSTGRQTGR